MDVGDLLMRIEYEDRGSTPYVCFWKVDAFTDQGVWLVFDSATGLEKCEESEVGFKVAERKKVEEIPKGSRDFFHNLGRSFSKPSWHNERLWRMTPLRFAYDNLEDAIRSVKVRNRKYLRHTNRKIDRMTETTKARFEAMNQPLPGPIGGETILPRYRRNDASYWH